MEKQLIDSSVPLGGLPLEWVKTAEWVDEIEIIAANGLERQIPRKKRKINGFVFDEMTPTSVWKEVLKFYPRVPVMIPENDMEREKRSNGGKWRAAQNVVWNGVEFAMPKGIPVMVPEPIAEMVNHLNEDFRSKEIMDIINELTDKGSALS